MAPDEGTKWNPLLKAPAVEIIDLESEDESANKVLNPSEHAKDRDASLEGSDNEDDNEDSLWEDVLNEDEDQALIHGSKPSANEIFLLVRSNVRR